MATACHTSIQCTQNPLWKRISASLGSPPFFLILYQLFCDLCIRHHVHGVPDAAYYIRWLFPTPFSSGSSVSSGAGPTSYSFCNLQPTTGTYSLLCSSETKSVSSRIRFLIVLPCSRLHPFQLHPFQTRSTAATHRVFVLKL
jgi:hypothetical protein